MLPWWYIPKPGKPCIYDIKNKTGIFWISVLLSILIRLLLHDEYGKVDGYMSDLNIGSRKNRRIQDHLFIIDGIIFDHARSKKVGKGISIGIYDYLMCFDSLWQEEIINDVYEAGVINDKLALLYVKKIIKSLYKLSLVSLREKQSTI